MKSVSSSVEGRNGENGICEYNTGYILVQLRNWRVVLESAGSGENIVVCGCPNSSLISALVVLL